MSKGPLLATSDGVLLNLRVSPGARRTAVEGPYGEDALKLRVAAPPVDGKANAEVERFLAGLVGARRSDVTLVRGASGRDKVALVKSVGEARVREALSSHLP